MTIVRWRGLWIGLVTISVVVLAIGTVLSVRPVPRELVDRGGDVKARLMSRDGYPLSLTYQHDWNLHDRLELHEIPRQLQTSVLFAEDQRFFEHAGIDWKARLHALVQNVAALRPVRGASTITEQTVRMLYPRPRRLWSRWLEGFEAMQLEQRFSKSEIFEFYLNQVPYAANRRGVAQAARYFFDRSVDTTTLDATVQSLTQALLDRRLVGLNQKRVHNGAVLVVDHRDNSILAWCVGQPFPDTPSGEVNAVVAPRQPGSALKPFVYAMALEKGWTAATRIDDAPLAESVGAGLHRYDNYSRQHYGLVSLREALANSLNIPAVKTLQHVGQTAFLHRLQTLGINSLTAHPDQYGDGLALGNGEISLFELVQAYTVLARGGIYTPLTSVDDPSRDTRRVFPQPVASLIGNILSDDHARGLEFGAGGVLNLPVQTAVKTGTSTGHRDTWAVGFNHRYTVGVWMGNLDRTPTDGLTGASGPAFVLRGIFAALNQIIDPRPLYLSPALIRKEYCLAGAASGCRVVSEWFVPGTGPLEPQIGLPVRDIFIRHPSDGLLLAMDPRIEDVSEQFRFALSRFDLPIERVEWRVDDEVAGIGNSASYLWTLAPGRHVVEARLWWDEVNEPFVTRPVFFEVR